MDLTPLGTPSSQRGIGRYIRDLALGLSKLAPSVLGGIEIVGLTSLDWWGNCTTTSDLSTSVVAPRLPLPTEKDHYLWAYRHRIALFRAARSVAADAVHVCDPHATPLFLRSCGVRRIVTAHDLVPTLFPERYFGWKDGGAFLGRQIERRRYGTADLVVAISDATRKDVCRLLRVPEERVTRVYNGVDVGFWAGPPAIDAMSTLRRFDLLGRSFLLYVGGADWRKNVEGMMRGLALARARGADVELVWAGHLSDEHSRSVRAVVHGCGVEGAVRYLDFVTDDELRVLYGAAVAHVIVSRAEGFGLTVVEAMASGCPVLTTRSGALGEVAGQAALTVDPEDVEGIGDGMRRLVQEPELRKELREKGNERAPRFSRDAQAHAMAAVYRRFFSSEGRGSGAAGSPS
ncbi:MAG TPA: glycosyltransferase family 1 protein [Polyangiaceae bacterium]